MTYPTGKTSAEYTPCVIVWPDGHRTRGNVLHVRLDTAESAREKLQRGRAAWLAEDVARTFEHGDA